MFIFLWNIEKLFLILSGQIQVRFRLDGRIPFSGNLNPDLVNMNSDPALSSGFESGKSGNTGSVTLILLVAVHHHVHNKSYFQQTIFHQQKYQNSEGNTETGIFFLHMSYFYRICPKWWLFILFLFVIFWLLHWKFGNVRQAL